MSDTRNLEQIRRHSVHVWETSTSRLVGPKAPRYERGRDLPALIPMLGSDPYADTSPARRRVLALLRRALHRERCLGRAGHWSYDLGRHAALLSAYRTELERYHSDFKS